MTDCPDCGPAVIPATNDQPPKGYEAVKTPSGWLHVIELRACEYRTERVKTKPNCSKCKSVVMYCTKKEQFTSRSECRTCGG